MKKKSYDDILNVELPSGVYLVCTPLPGNNRSELTEYRIVYLQAGHGITEQDVYDKSYPSEKILKFENIPFSTEYDSVFIKAEKLAKKDPVRTLQFNRSFCAMRKFPARRVARNPIFDGIFNVPTVSTRSIIFQNNERDEERDNEQYGEDLDP